MKQFLAVLLVVAFCFSLTGCGFWMDGDYVSVKPHMDQTILESEEVIAVSSYAQLRSALSELVDTGAQSGIISISSFNAGTVHFYVDTAIKHIMNDTPIGAYAVDDITYEIGTNRGASVVALRISYRHDRSQILRIQQVSGMEDAAKAVSEALDNCDAAVVLHVTDYEAVDFTQLVQDYANENPDRVVETPAVNAAVYPDKGAERLVELTFTYQTSRETLRQMQQQVASVFTSAELYVKEASQIWDVYSRLYSFLMERDEYTVQTSITPAYSLLHHGVGDSRAFANVYAAMCRREELDCKVISGTRAGEPWCWNLVRFRGKYYHVDLLQCNQTGTFQMLSDEEMTGYVWDYSAYSAN